MPDTDHNQLYYELRLLLDRHGVFVENARIEYEDFPIYGSRGGGGGLKIDLRLVSPGNLHAQHYELANAFSRLVYPAAAGEEEVYETPQGTAAPCAHTWQPRTDTAREWSWCVKCGKTKNS